VIAYRRLLCAD